MPALFYYIDGNKVEISYSKYALQTLADRGKMFVLGVYTAQRVSYYNNINKAGIKRHIDNIVVKDTITENGQNKEVLSIKEREYYEVF